MHNLGAPGNFGNDRRHPGPGCAGRRPGEGPESRLNNDLPRCLSRSARCTAIRLTNRCISYKAPIAPAHNRARRSGHVVSCGGRSVGASYRWCHWLSAKKDEQGNEHANDHERERRAKHEQAPPGLENDEPEAGLADVLVPGHRRERG